MANRTEEAADRMGRLYWASILVIATLGCAPSKSLPGDAGTIVKFRDDVPNELGADPPALIDLTFTNSAGEVATLADFRGKKNVVLVFVRGMVGSLPDVDGSPSGRSFCTYCATQTSRLISNYEEFRKRDAEVVVIVPIVRPDEGTMANQFANRIFGKEANTGQVPFPIWLDVQLKAVDGLGIRQDLSKPATYILDKSGSVQFAYVGKSMADRPSVKAMLDQLDRLNSRK